MSDPARSSITLMILSNCAIRLPCSRSHPDVAQMPDERSVDQVLAIELRERDERALRLVDVVERADVLRRQIDEEDPRDRLPRVELGGDEHLRNAVSLFGDVVVIVERRRDDVPDLRLAAEEH